MKRQSQTNFYDMSMLRLALRFLVEVKDMKFDDEYHNL